MNARTLKALQGSIKKWEGIVAGKERDDGQDNCPLCKLFIDEDCEKCPVSAQTGHASCDGTPYDLWRELSDYSHGVTADTPERLKVARAELRFLKSLLPRITNK